ncbi:nucleoside diphosphate kinase 6-like [Arctopsyche grandis]|uniref:nucleoside diphosphate kinase 6-like n=1 Tax=Arctopsyche grandis TaxID=121162 RepID=UPI00406D8CA0
MRSLTLAVLKPQLVANTWGTKQVQRLIRQQGFRVEATRRLIITPNLAHRLYHQHQHKFFYQRLVTSICSGPVVAHILSRENAIQRWRDMLGPTQVYKAVYSHPNSIRGQFGLTDTRNAAHGSDSLETVSQEIPIFFPEFSVEDWYTKEKSNIT